MDTKVNKLGIVALFLVTLFTFPTYAYDDDEPRDIYDCSNAVNVMDCIEQTGPNKSKPAPAYIDLQPAGWTGPASLAVRYDNQLGWIPEIGFVKLFYDNGINLLGAYGANEARANITLGHAFNAHQQVKITYEYLAQKLPFDFTSGDVNQWVSQNAFGASYRYLLKDSILRSFDVNGYYILANSKNLPEVFFYQNNITASNLRRIAGGNEQTITSGFSLSPSQHWIFNVGGGYSHLQYNTQYETHQDNSTLAYHVGMDVLITPLTQFTANLDNNAAETNGVVKISRIFPGHVEAAVTGQYSQGQSGQPNSAAVTLGFAYPVSTYAFGDNDSLGALKSWIEKPVIRATRVLAIKDEKVVQYTIDSEDPLPQNLMTGQIMQEINTQSMFHFDPSLYDQVTYTISSNPLNIGMKNDPSSSKNMIVYSTAPIPNSAIPNGEPVSYAVMVTASGYKKDLPAPIQSQTKLVITVTFDKNNEPQWSSTSSSINFDADSAVNGGINLNNMTKNNGQTPIKFYFADDSAKYSAWDIIYSGNTAYLVRKANVNGAFNAADITATPQELVISAQYADDPAGVSVPGQTIKVTVTADNQIKFKWQSGGNCQDSSLKNLMAYQPQDDNAHPSTDLALSPCIIYIGHDGRELKVANDNVVYQLQKTDNYPGNISVSGENANARLNVFMPQANALNHTYNPVFSVKSLAQGGAASAGVDLNADGLITVGKQLWITINGTNSFPIKEGSTYITSMVVDLLEGNHSYKINAAVPAPSPTYTMLSPGDIENAEVYDQYNNAGKIQFYPNSVQPENGKISILWYSVTAYPQISSIVLSQDY